MELIDTKGLAVLAMIPGEEERRGLAGILSRSAWKLNFVATFQEACDKLAQSTAAVVLTDADLPGERSWRDVIKLTQGTSPPPPVIVVSRLGDERLWAEVLNLGGFDLLLKPFEANEVLHAIRMAGRSWRDRIVTAGRRLEATGQSIELIRDNGLHQSAES